MEASTGIWIRFLNQQNGYGIVVIVIIVIVIAFLRVSASVSAIVIAIVIVIAVAFLSVSVLLEKYIPRYHTLLLLLLFSIVPLLLELLLLLLFAKHNDQNYFPTLALYPFSPRPRGSCDIMCNSICGRNL